MSLHSIAVPATIHQVPIDSAAEQLIDLANDAIESFMISTDFEVERFVTCDFHLFDQAITWMRESKILPGNLFCELGSGFGVATMLAARQGMKAIGIEIERCLVDPSVRLAEQLENAAQFYQGSYIPNGRPDATGMINHEADIYDEIGLHLSEIDLFFAYPWPDEQDHIRALIDSHARSGAYLLNYQGRTGMRLWQKK